MRYDLVAIFIIYNKYIVNIQRNKKPSINLNE